MAAKFTVEVTEFGVFDAGRQDIDLPKDQGADRRGPRLLIRGRIRNDNREPIHRGGAFATLSACFPGGRCVDRPSHGRGFLVPLAGEDPWRPGSWRGFLTVTRPLDPIYREKTPDDVEAILKLRVEGPEALAWEGDVWKSPVDWRALQGYAVLQSVTLTPRGATKKLGGARPITATVDAIAGLQASLSVEGVHGWVRMVEFPELKALVGHPATPTALPYRVQSADVELEIRVAREHVRHGDGRDEPDGRFLLLDVTLRAGPAARRAKITASAFRVLYGNQKWVGPMSGAGVTAHPLDLGTLAAGEERRGTVVFEWPFGTGALVLEVALPGAPRSLIALEPAVAPETAAL